MQMYMQAACSLAAAQRGGFGGGQFSLLRMSRGDNELRGAWGCSRRRSGAGSGESAMFSKGCTLSRGSES